MRESIFKFKKFQVKNHLSAMKVGTDGVLLGAWCPLAKSDNLILDIGTGCGLISLMIAQRTQNSFIIGVEIDHEAANEAKDNVENSLWKERISIINQNIEDFANATHYRFNRIISNPPFFIEDTLSPNRNRSTARNASSLPFDTLFKLSSYLLNENGEFSLITPFSSKAAILNLASTHNLFLKNFTIVYPTLENIPKRILWNFSKIPNIGSINDTLTIEKERHIYTSEYINLTKDFYLKM